MFVAPSFKKSLIVQQFQGNYRDGARNKVHVYHACIIQHFTNNTNKRQSKERFNVKIDNIQPESTRQDSSC